MGRKNQTRRAFLGALLASAIAPARSYAGPERTRVVGYLSGGQKADFLVAALARLGWIEGKNLRFEVRIPPDWEPKTLAQAATELVAARPDVLVANHPWRVHALARATHTIPIVSMGTPDPVSEGIAQSLRRPGGNVTGLSLAIPEALEATFRLMRQMRPTLRRVAMLYSAEPRPAFLEPSARVAGLEPTVIRVTARPEIEPALAPFAGQAMVMAPAKNVELVGVAYETAHRLRIATAGEEGALMGYGLDFPDSLGRVCAIIDKILRGADPAEIPFELPDRPSFRLDRGIARRIGIDIPPDVLLRVTQLVD